MKKIFGILAVIFSLIVVGCSNPAMNSIPEAKWEVAAVEENTVKVTNAPDSKYIGCYVHRYAMWSNVDPEFARIYFNINCSNYATAEEAAVGINNLLKSDTVCIYYSAEKNTVWINADDFTEAEKPVDAVLVTDN